MFGHFSSWTLTTFYEMSSRFLTMVQDHPRWNPDHVFMVFDDWPWTTTVIHQIPSPTMIKWPWSSKWPWLTLVSHDHWLSHNGQPWSLIIRPWLNMVNHGGPWSLIVGPWLSMVNHGRLSNTVICHDQTDPGQPWWTMITVCWTMVIHGHLLLENG